MKTINTYLPLFSGFYGTIWEADETPEIENINYERESKGLEPISYDDCKWDYKEYELNAVKNIINYLENELYNIRLIDSIEFEEIVSPREYNFANDSVNIIISLNAENESNILLYLKDNNEEFEKYLKDKYTSCPGFISYYPNNVNDFMSGNPLEDKHKLGSILDFILLNEGLEEMDIYNSIGGNCISAENYNELIEENN